MAGFTGSNNIGVYTLASGELVSEAPLAEGIPRFSAGVSQLGAQVLCMRLEVVSGALLVVAFDRWASLEWDMILLALFTKRRGISTSVTASFTGLPSILTSSLSKSINSFQTQKVPRD